MLISFRWKYLIVGILALGVAIHFESGIGNKRVQGYFANSMPNRVLASIAGPEETVSVIEYQAGGRALLINSSTAAGESPFVDNTHYMAWLGHLPMLLAPSTKNALVICFGTGQTANAVRKENPQTVDVVDVNANIFKLAHYFKSNERVLEDPKVHASVMDGRAYLRRTKKIYDVITLEPMPPVSIGINALYSLEFYLIAKKQLSNTGVIAQWLPFHNVAPHYAASIAKTFIHVFPNAILWVDPRSKNGILIGSNDKTLDLVKNWPGFARDIHRDLSKAEVLSAITLDRDGLQRYSEYGELIRDDNQLLAYGRALYAYAGLQHANFDLIRRVKRCIR